MRNRDFSPSDVGAFLRRKRFEYNYSQSDLAKLLGISKIAVSNWENGQAVPDVKYWIPLSNILGISIDELLFPNVESESDKYSHITDQFQKISNVDFKDQTLIKKLIDLFIENKKEIANLIYQYKDSRDDNLADKILKSNKFGFCFFCSDFSLSLNDIKKYKYSLPVEDILTTVWIADIEQYIENDFGKNDIRLAFCVLDDPLWETISKYGPNSISNTPQLRTAILNFIFLKGGEDLFKKYLSTFSQAYRNALIRRYYTRYLNKEKLDVFEIRVLQMLLRSGCKYYVGNENKTHEIWERVAVDI